MLQGLAIDGKRFDLTYKFFQMVSSYPNFLSNLKWSKPQILEF
jgi:hypothetical protein